LAVIIEDIIITTTRTEIIITLITITIITAMITDDIITVITTDIKIGAEIISDNARKKNNITLLKSQN
jgi:hypothetical protein